MPSLFPYAIVRGGQEDFLHDVEDAVKSRQLLLAHAPTGIGKTVASLAPALEYALEKQKTILFLTPKHTQHTIVIDTLASINLRHKVNATAVDIIGKRWMCQHNVEDLDSREFNEFCRSKKKDETCAYYNNVRKGRLTDKALEMIAQVRGALMHNEEIVKRCSDKNLCPYEICIEAGKKSNVIICDYFHVFSPKIREAFLGKLEKELEDCILIVDEAHNLPERVRKLLSVNLGDYVLKMAAKEAAVLGRKNLESDLEDIARILKKFARKLGEGDERFVAKDELASAIKEATKTSYDDILASLDALGDEVLKIPNRYRSYARIVYNFLDSWTGEDIGYARILRKTDKGVILSYKCLDPAVSCKPVFDAAHSAVLMSGTLLPLAMYAEVLGLDKKRRREGSYASPFPPENKLGLIVTGMTTKYAKRSDLMYRKYAEAIRHAASYIPGNIAVFHPAYHIMNAIGRELVKHPLNKPLLMERKEMTKGERKELYSRLIRMKDGSGGMLMGVQAGSLSEGVDYPDNMLSAVLIIGLPLERPDLETQALIDYYDVKFQRGWDYGYTYPAMNRALQAAGRCIRSGTDKGAILLMDERYRWANYRKCLPDDYGFRVTENPQEQLEKFFNSRN
ncbi:MAG: ATP-dependent DNA helicase [Candidatus Altiarchaeota archaeon]|nr:ATP-dependent DNA helicase [Candidatus Altiarchaeota archaeon]